MTQWAEGVPDWRDAGRRVVIQQDDGTEVEGRLEVADQYFDGEDEHPVFSMRTDNGQTPDFYGARHWRFA